MHNVIQLIVEGPKFHFHTIHSKIMLPAISLFFLVLIYRAIRQKGDLHSLEKASLALIISLIVINAASVFLTYEPILDFLNVISRIFSTFQFKRIVVLTPYVWYLSFFLMLIWIENIPHKKTYYLRVVGILTIFLFQLDTINQDSYFYRSQARKSKKPSFEAYTSREQFSEVKGHINKPTETYRVAAFGIDPAVLHYNEFYTIDGMFTDYPLAYKKEFTAIIRSELEKNDQLKKFFSNWGNALYLASSEKVGMSHHKGSYKPIHNLSWDIKQLRKLRVSYVISSAKILNNLENSLILDRIFAENGFYHIYLYKVQ